MVCHIFLPLLFHVCPVKHNLSLCVCVVKHNLCVDLKKYVTELLCGFDDNGIFENR